MDKIDRLFDAVEHPDRYSDAELETMLQDSELRDAYNLITKVKDAFTPIPTIDLDAEWSKFEQTIPASKQGLISFFSRHAAAAMIIVVASLAAVAAGIGITISLNNHKSIDCEGNKSDLIEIVSTTAIEIDNKEEIEPEVIIFKEETLDKILSDIAGYYGVDVNFVTDDAKLLRLHLKWDQSKPLTEIVETLNNFEQIRITLSDNKLTVE